MTLSEEQYKEQAAQTAALLEELSNLNASFDQALKQVGLSEKDVQGQVDVNALPAELRAEYQAAVDKAQREGKERAARCQSQQSASGVPGAGRRDVIRL